MVPALGVAQPDVSSSADRQVQVEDNGSSAAAAKLAGEVGGVAHSGTIARAKKEKLISAAMREAVLSVARYVKDPDDMLKIAVDLTTVAAQAAPQFADTIARATSFAGPVANLDGAGARIRAAAYAGAKNPRTARTPESSRKYASDPAGDPGGTASIGSPMRVTRHNSNGDESAPSTGILSKISSGDNSGVDLTAVIGVSHDSNIFLSNGDAAKGKAAVAETITSVTPGVAFKFGQNSLAHGSLGYKVAFTRYAHKSASDAKLGTGSADFGYDSGSIALDAAATYQQSNDATLDTAGRNVLVPRNSLALAANVEPSLTAKTSVQAGVAFDWTEYKLPGFIGSKNITVPVKAYFEVTPKLALSAGVSYARATPQGVGPNSRDLFYNVGLRGNLTEKLTSNFSVGYRTRRVADNPTEALWGFDGSFSYQASPKTNLSLVSSRNFGLSATGESTKSSSYFLNFSTNPSLHWQFSGAIGHRDVNYGPKVFAQPATPPLLTKPTVGRSDSYTEGNMSASYIFTSWFNTSATWTHRLNHSNDANSDFSGNVLSLMLAFQY